jgi:5-methylcytosine-specific restriction endonuclease McrA
MRTLSYAAAQAAAAHAVQKDASSGTADATSAGQQHQKQSRRHDGDATHAHTYALTPLPPPTAAALAAAAPASVADSLAAYAILPAGEHYAQLFLASVLSAYAAQATAAPRSIATAHTSATGGVGAQQQQRRPQQQQKKPAACELCARDWVPLTYHHLVPRAVHAKARARGWHPAWRLDAVAWLCRACHDFVHRAASNEELAQRWWSVERLRQRDDVQAWVRWVGRVRWKKR